MEIKKLLSLSSRYIFLGLCVVLTSTALLAQDDDLEDPLNPTKSRPRIFIGPTFGYNRVSHPGGFQSFSTDVLCPTFQNGSANGFYAGLNGEYLIGDPKTSKSSIVVRVLYNNLPSSFTATGDNLPSLDTASGNTYYSSTEHTASIAYSTIDLDLQYRLSIGNTPFGIIAGPSIGYVMTSKVDQRFSLTDPEKRARFDRSSLEDAVNTKKIVRFDENQREQVVKDQNIDQASAIRIALKVGLQYEFILKRIQVVPHVYYNLGITGVNSVDSWRVNAIQVGVDVRFAL